MSMRLKIIVGSTRPGRIGPAIGRWVEKIAQEHDAFDVELLDLAAFELPLLDEGSHPLKQDYQGAEKLRSGVFPLRNGVF